MAKAPSAEIGSRRYYHHNYTWGPAGTLPDACGCDPAKPSLACDYTFPSVTTILKVLPKEWLGAWAAKMVAQTALDEIDNLAAMLSQEGREAVEKYLKGAPWRKRDAAAEKGTTVHDAAEKGTAIEDLPENARARVLAWHAWLDDYRPSIRCQEVTVYGVNGPHRYAGTFDLHADLPDGSWLIDIKSGSWGWEARLQQAAYRFADFDADGQPVPHFDHVGILDLKDDGYSFHEIVAGEQEYAAFMCAAEMSEHVSRMSKEPKGTLMETGR